ncbi:MAG: DNA polymerase III subunit beta [Candidatus Cloacimonadota bacterium]|nr:DNA polymerase III subunit beta [Candidatus Cloacimonadota bacterium]
MKFSIEKNQILNKIQFINSIVPIRNPLPILTNILLEADEENNIIRLSSTDLEVTAVSEIECQVKEGGKIAIPAKNITEIIRYIPEDEIHFSVKENKCRIKCLNTDFSLICANPEDFPEIPERNWESSFTINAKLFSKIAEKTSFAVADQFGRPAFSGILWELDEHLQKMVATDGKRLGKYEIQLPLNIEKRSIIMPIKGLNLVRRIITDEIPDLRILAEESAISFDYNSYKIYSRLIEANYPDYEAVIPYDNSKIVEIDLESLKNAVHRVSLLASEDTFTVMLNFSKNQLEISSEDVEKGSADEILEISAESTKIESFQIGFNYKYLLEILNLIDSEKVQIKFENSLDPVLFYNTEYPENEENVFLLMPLRLSEST